MTTEITNRVKALIRDLAGLQPIVDTLERIDSLEQAEREAKTRMGALREEVSAAQAAAAQAVENAKAEAQTVLDGLAAEVEAAKDQKLQLDQQIQQKTGELAKVTAEVESAMSDLQQTRDQLTQIATRIGS